MIRTNYIYVDFENVQETDLDRIANKPVKVALVLGERHKSLPIKCVKLIQKYSSQVRVVETGLNGKNALDFVLAFEIGVESEKDPNGYFHVLSRDKGFDALIKHLKLKGVHAARHSERGEPYPGAKPHYIVEEGQLTSVANLPGILFAIAESVPEKKKKSKKSRASK